MGLEVVMVGTGEKGRAGAPRVPKQTGKTPVPALQASLLRQHLWELRPLENKVLFT